MAQSKQQESVLSSFLGFVKEHKIKTALAVTAVAGISYYAYRTFSGAHAPVPQTPAPAFLTGTDEIKTVTIKSKRRLNHDSFIFSFALPDGHVLGCPAGHHIGIHLNHTTASGETKLVRKPYTPISLPTQQGSFDLLIKVYKLEGDQGKHTSQLEKLQEGDEVSISGSFGKKEYVGKGVISATLPDTPKTVKTYSKISFLAAGTGITPFLSTLRKANADPEDKTEFTLLFSNKTVDDILQKDELTELAAKGRLKVVFTVTRQNEVAAKDVLVGRFTKESLQKHLPAPSQDHLVMYCGTKSFNEAISSYLSELGYQDN